MNSNWVKVFFACVVVSAVLVIVADLPLNPFKNKEIPAAEKVSFNRDIRPIFNAKCLSCHGGVTMQGGISYIFREEALKRGNSGRLNVVPGKPNRSELIARVRSDDPLLRMPYKKDPLDEEEIKLLERWIEQGAEWEEHWAFLPPQQIEPPAQPFTEWSNNPIDAFIGIELEEAGLRPAPEAQKEELLRRVSLDLIGLPPTLTEIAAFLSDESEDAYERLVDRILASPRFGERWASQWLDLARYADSMGYVRDLERDSWPYRDWVINSYNENMPYDEFIRLQLAGDLVSGGGLDGWIASAFNRQTPTNLEGGSDNEEYRMVAVMDRVATTWSVLNGITMACVQCHAHPYDPIVHDAYYESLAFFNSSSDYDLVDDAPTIRVPVEFDSRAEAYEIQVRKLGIMDEFLASLKQLDGTTKWTEVDIITAYTDRRAGWSRRLALVEAMAKQAEGLAAEEDKDKYLKMAEGAREQIAMPENIVVNADKIDGNDVHFPVDVAAVSEYVLTANPVNSEVMAFRIEGVPIDSEKALHTPETGFAFEEISVVIRHPNGEEENIELQGIVADTRDAIKQQTDNIFARALYGTSVISGFSAEKLHFARNVVLVPTVPVKMSAGDKLIIRLAQAQLMRYRQPAPVLRRLKVSYTTNDRWQKWIVQNSQAELIESLIAIDERVAALPGADLPVMVELPRDVHPQTRLFDRGDMLKKTGKPLAGNVPDVFPSMLEEGPRDRMAMANWFVSEEQPLTARVEVNRYWEQLFGKGLVETLEDFGSSGLLPTHPELLDWLAWQFQHVLNWDRKAIIRQIVTSQTYKQSAKCGEAQHDKDPQNQLYSCGPRQRLTAEMVRDQALVAGGLMVNKIGGPPVMPPQPDGIWNSFKNKAQWIEATGDDRYRRAIYTYFKQSTPYPSFIIFDHATRDVSMARRIPTSTPLHALVTLNDPVFVEAGAALADQMADSARNANSREAGIRIGYTRVTSIMPSSSTVDALQDTFEKIVTETGEADDAWQAVAMVLLNVDQAMSR